jgi:hypothetical protein
MAWQRAPEARCLFPSMTHKKINSRLKAAFCIMAALARMAASPP